MPGRRYTVHGRVQGVGFRWWTRSQAQRLGLAGTVRNLPDGTVEVRASAPAGTLERFEALLRQGPPGAEVKRVETEPAEEVSQGGFEILK